MMNWVTRFLAALVLVCWLGATSAPGHESESHPLKKAALGKLKETWTMVGGGSVYGVVTKVSEADDREITFREIEPGVETASKIKAIRESELSQRDREYLERHLSGEVAGKVIGIVDGDTLDILTPAKERLRIRLHGIDAPERGQGFNQKAKQHLSELAYLKEVHVHLDVSDRWGREVGMVFEGDDNRNVNLAMITAGFAWHYAYYLNSFEFTQAQEQAKSKRKGLWVDANPVNPKDFRGRSRSPIKKAAAETIGCQTRGRKIRLQKARLVALSRRPVQAVTIQPRESLVQALWAKVAPQRQLHWLNTNPTPNKRHVRGGCPAFANTKEGRFCGPDDGELCKNCKAEIEKLSSLEKSRLRR